MSKKKKNKPILRGFVTKPVSVYVEIFPPYGTPAYEGYPRVLQIEISNDRTGEFSKFFEEVVKHLPHGLLELVEYDAGPLLAWTSTQLGQYGSVHEMSLCGQEVADPSMPHGVEVEYFLTCAPSCPCYDEFDGRMAARIRRGQVSAEEFEALEATLYVAGKSALDRLPKIQEAVKGVVGTLSDTANKIDVSINGHAFSQGDVIRVGNEHLVVKDATGVMSRRDAVAMSGAQLQAMQDKVYADIRKKMDSQMPTVLSARSSAPNGAPFTMTLPEPAKTDLSLRGLSIPEPESWLDRIKKELGIGDIQ